MKGKTSRCFSAARKDVSPDILAEAAASDRLIGYEATGPERGTRQGLALVAVGGGGQATKAGIWVEGAHNAASDRAFDDFMSNQESVAPSGLLLYHFCSGSPVGVRSRAKDASCHIDSFRLLSAQDASKLPWATEEVKDFYENLTASKTCAEQSGGIRTSRVQQWTESLGL